jgi:hypothetical protein
MMEAEISKKDGNATKKAKQSKANVERKAKDEEKADAQAGDDPVVEEQAKKLPKG